MLLLKKKKYAALKVELDGSLVQEQKGLDIVRRDWCGLAKDAGHHALKNILTTRCETAECVVVRLRTSLCSRGLRTFGVCAFGLSCAASTPRSAICKRCKWPLYRPACNLIPCYCLLRSREEVVEEIHTKLRDLRAALDAGKVPLGQFVITKQLTKQPDQYPDAKNQPHVQVGRRVG